MSDAIILTDLQRAFLATPKLFAALATTDEDGAPRQVVIWYRLLDDGRILVNGRSPGAGAPTWTGPGAPPSRSRTAPTATAGWA